MIDILKKVVKYGAYAVVFVKVVQFAIDLLETQDILKDIKKED